MSGEVLRFPARPRPRLLDVSLDARGRRELRRMRRAIARRLFWRRLRRALFGRGGAQ